jgi:perosamine synthetase
MIPRRRIYIRWSDLFFGICRCLWPSRRNELARRVEQAWSPDDDSMVCFSVRSGFDLLLQVLGLPRGSEILVSAVTIPAMIRIIEHHGLVPVPLDLDMQDLAVKLERLERAHTDKTRAIVVAHLFGSRMPLDDILRFARQHSLYVIEDCAQAYIGNHHRGHPDADVSMFSFDPAKTNTALGGGLLRVKDPALLSELKRRQAHYPVQRRGHFVRQLGKYAVAKLLYHPRLYGLFCRLCRLLHTNHEQLTMLRGRSHTVSLDAIRRQPSAALLALLERRLQQFDSTIIEQRIQVAHKMLTLLPTTRHPGAQAAEHSYWLFPICVEYPDELKWQLWQHGFDATRVATQVVVVKPPSNRPELYPVEAQQTLEQILYLPVYLGISTRDLQRLADTISAFEAQIALPAHLTHS